MESWLGVVNGVPVHPLLVQLCYLGRRELGVYANRVELALGDSEYNRAELEALGDEQAETDDKPPDIASHGNPPTPNIPAPRPESSAAAAPFVGAQHNFIQKL